MDRRTQRLLRAVAALALVGLLSIDCCNATGSWAWNDLGRAPHLAAVRSATGGVLAAPRRLRADLSAVPAPAPPVLLVVVLLLGLLSIEAWKPSSWSSATGPPGRAPPGRDLLGTPG